MSSLLSRKPRFLTSRPEPPVCSMVSVYSTTLPSLSVTVRFVVSTFSVSGEVPSTARAVVAQEPSKLDASPAATGLDAARVGLRSAGALGGEPVGEQGLGRHVDLLRVTDVLAAVGEGECGRLEVVVQGVLRCHGRQVEALEDVQRLADGGAAGRHGRHAEDVEPAVVAAGRLLVARLVALQVGDPHEAPRHREVGVGALRGLAGGADDLAWRAGRGRTPSMPRRPSSR